VQVDAGGAGHSAPQIREEDMNASQTATLVYGALALLLLAAFSVVMHSPTALLLTVVTAGLAWVFQSLEAVVEQGTPSALLLEIVYGIIPTLFILATVIAYFG